MPKIIDLTKPIKNYPEESRFLKVKIKHKSHFIGKLEVMFLGLPLHLFPKNFIGWANDTIKSMGVHSTTHIDAPWHYAPIINGVKARTVDEIPLEWCYGDGVVIDMTHKKDMDIITREDIQKAVRDTGVSIKEGTIVLIRTGRDSLMGKKEYMSSGTGMSAEATEWLIDHGVKVMGIDQWGWDLPLAKQAKRIKQKISSPESYWEGHRVGSRKEYCHLEQVVGLHQLPLQGFKVMAMPLPLQGCSASPVRLIAIIGE